MSYKLLHGDCLELMRELPDGSVDLVLTDPPYGVTCCSWDKPVDLNAFCENVMRILKPTGTLLCFANALISNELWRCNAKYWKYNWVWVKPRGCNFMNCKTRPMNNVEFITVFSKGIVGHRSLNAEKRMTYNPQGIKCIHKKCKPCKNQYNSVARPSPSLKPEYIQEATGYPLITLYFSPVCNTKRFHVSQKPVDLLEYLIRTYTNENETVLDPFMGSGSTGVAALGCRRKFIGMELEEKYCEMAKERIDTTIDKMADNKEVVEQ